MVCRMNCWFVTSHGLRVIQRNGIFCGCGTWSLTGREEQTKNARKQGAEEYIRTEEKVSERRMERIA